MMSYLSIKNLFIAKLCAMLLYFAPWLVDAYLIINTPIGFCLFNLILVIPIFSTLIVHYRVP